MVGAETILYIFLSGLVGIICMSWCCKYYNRSPNLLGIEQNDMLENNNHPSILQLEVNNSITRRILIRHLEMNPSVIPRLAHKPYEMIVNVDFDKECIICMEKIEKRECRLNCGHGYHYNCIKEWAYDRQNNTCPQCRESIIECII
jgi:hypothetical protein